MKVSVLLFGEMCGLMLQLLLKVMCWGELLFRFILYICGLLLWLLVKQMLLLLGENCGLVLMLVLLVRWCRFELLVLIMQIWVRLLCVKVMVRCELFGDQVGVELLFLKLVMMECWWVIRFWMQIIGFFILKEMQVILVLFGDQDGEMIGLLECNVICVFFLLVLVIFRWYLFLDLVMQEMWVEKMFGMLVSFWQMLLVILCVVRCSSCGWVLMDRVESWFDCIVLKR